MKTYYLKCYLCGKVHTEQESVTSCLVCGGPIETYYDYQLIAKKLNAYSLKNAPISAMKYIMFYPIDDFQNIISLAEGGTPLIHAKKLGEKYGLKKLYIKNEGVNPTGCFKDRGTLVEITKAIEIGAEAICLASSGNMAASCAAYASAAGIPCYILVPEGTPVGKLAQTLSFGARVIQVRGDYSQCADLAVQMSKKFGYYLAGDYTFRTEGQKSEGYEIVEQLYWKAPDYVVCPIGVGTNFHAIAKGFKEFYDFGFIDKLPKLIGVQTTGCNPVVSAFKQNRRDYDILKHPNTIASAIAVGNPFDAPKILDDIYAFGGKVVEIDDEFLLQVQQEQARNSGVFSEPAGCLAMSAVKKLAQENYFKSDDVIVCIATGSGLKDPKSPLKILPEPASVEPDFTEIEKFITQKLYAIKEGGQSEKNKMIFTANPESLDEVIKTLKAEFGLDVSNEIANSVNDEIKNFLQKGKKVCKSDLQYILEEVLNEIDLKDRVLEIKDFSIKTGLHEPAEATIKIVAFNQTMTLSHKGVGTVDAAITALRNGLKEHDILEVKLIDYEVGIDSAGVDSTVEVKITCTDNRGNKVVAKATSPDVIVASIKAFELGFNLLYAKK